GAEALLVAAQAAADGARAAERQASAAREDALRLVANLTRELGESDAQLARVAERIAHAAQRLEQIDAGLVEHELVRARLEESLGGARAALADFETEQEAAREQRLHWQVQEAHVAARLRAVT